MKKTQSYEDLVKMAERYGVADNALFLAAANQYAVQLKVIELIQGAIDEANLTTTKTYLAGTENLYANPLVRELPKHSDAANRTLGTMLDIIVKLGREKEEDDESFNCE